ncbi:hypothetical protein [Actinomadura miaoliensis]|uniref:Uncharacterized protein n=1 Tax=Actinomadura miaoliensis TaxID=430685 RepID=A0ABP7W7L2_9ACTN
MATAQCPSCGRPDVRVRTDGRLYRHQVDGAACDGSGTLATQPPQDADPRPPEGEDPWPPEGEDPWPPEGEDPWPPEGEGPWPSAGYATSTPRDSAGQTAEPPTEDDPQSEADPQTEEGTQAQSDGFHIQITVREPCPYLDDQAWHQANQRMAVRRAETAGHTVTGDARHTRTDHGLGSITLTYTVPINPTTA